MNFKDIFNIDAEVKESAHARVNLIGEHTDYTGGYVMPTLLSFKNTIEITENNTNEFIVYSQYFKEKKEFNDFKKSTNNEWVDYIKGCLHIFFEENKISSRYLNIYISSDIPLERGISSSSALCVATLKALNTLFETKIKDPEIAKLAKKVEFNYIGVSGGIMDQMVSSIGIHGKAFFMNCKNLEYELIDFPENWKFCLVDSEVQRNLRDSSYNERFAELQEAEKKLGIEYLGSVKKENFQKDKFDSNTIAKRAKHVVFENDRVINAKKNLIENNIYDFGKLMNESHESYSKDFEASTLDVDLIIQRSVECGALGARLTGGGFGGFTVSLIERNNFMNWYNKILNFYPAEKIFEVN